MAKLKKKDFDISKAQSMSSAEIALYLDDRERRFAKEYLQDRNGTQAAIRAGYKPGKNNASAAVQGTRLCSDPRIIAYRRSLMKDEIEKNDLTKDSVLMKLSEIVDRCMQAVEVMEWDSSKKCYVGTGTYNFNAKGATQALGEIAKLLGMYAPSKDNDTLAESIDSLVNALSGDEADRGY